MAPFIHARFWTIIYKKLLLTDIKSDWEIEGWYSKMAKKVMNKDTLCIIHASPIIHLDWKSMNTTKHKAVRRMLYSPNPDKDIMEKLIKQYQMSIKKNSNNDNNDSH